MGIPRLGLSLPSANPQFANSTPTDPSLTRFPLLFDLFEYFYYNPPFLPSLVGNPQDEAPAHGA
jgi:hypothetical protein